MSEIAATADNAAPHVHDLDEAIARGLVFLQRSQRPSGAFALYRSWDPAMEENCVDDSSPFGTALIAYSLGFSASAAARAILDRAAAFFLADMVGPGMWRYWTRDHPYYDNIPPDLDDIACVSVALRRHGTVFPDNRALVLANRNRAGLFYTWLIPRLRPIASASYWRITLAQLLRPVRFLLFWTLFASKPGDVDGVVNANVLFYLGDGQAAPSVVDYLVGIVQRGEEASCDKWHRNRFTFYYALSRNYEAGIAGLERVRDVIVDRIVDALRRDDRGDAGVLDTALAACALMNCHATSVELAPAVCGLLAAQRADGDWPALPLYYGGPVDGPGYGSEELTTGFCLEALLRHGMAGTEPSVGKRPVTN